MTGLITDPGFDSNRTEEYKLSIQVSLDGFSFSVIHENQKRLLAFNAMPVSLSSERFLGRRFNEWIQQNEILKKKFRNTSIIYYPEKFTFIPSDYYDYSKQKNIGNLVLDNPDDSSYADNYLPNPSGNVVFPVPAGLLETVKINFPGISLQHPVTILDAELHKLADLMQNPVALYFGKKSFSLLLYSGTGLKAINQFSYVSSDDVTFYILSILKKAGLSAEKSTLCLAGEINPKDPVYHSLHKFFKRTILFVPEIRVDPEIFNVPLHQYLILFP